MINGKFHLRVDFIKKYANIEPPFGFNGLGELTYMRTYSRLKPNGENERWYETVKRVVEGTYSIQKRHILKYDLGWDERKAHTSAEEMYDRMFNMKFLPPGRGLWAMGTEIIEERNLFPALNNCFAGTEKFITSGGLKTFESTVDTEQTVLTLNGEWAKGLIKSFGKQKIYNLKLSRQGIEKIIQTTANHRWLSRTKSEINHNKPYSEKITTNLQNGDRIPYMFGQKPINPSPHGIVAGFVFGDGTKGRLDLQKGKDEIILPFLSEFNKIEHETFVTIKDIPEHYKDFPSLKWDRKYLYGWLMGYFLADGCVSSEQIVLSSAKKENLKFVKEVCTILGIGTYSVSLSSTFSNFSDKRKLWKLSFIPSTIPNKDFFLLPKHKLDFNKNKILRYWNVVSVIETNEEKKVYCAVVPEKESFTLEDNILTKNCAFVSTENLDKDLAKPFMFMMDYSMLGVGVGFDVKGAGKVTIKKPIGEFNYTIPDSREGWVESIRVLIEAYFTGTAIPTFNYSLIREYGTLIRTFGGKSAGSDPLKKLHKQIITMFNSHIGKPITITHIVDIMNMIGVCIVSGNARRSAQIVFGESNSEEYIKLKDYKWDDKKQTFIGGNTKRAEYGWLSNNSIFSEIGMDYRNIAKQTGLNGEPGYFWLDNARAYGRLADSPNWKDWRAVGANPCNEQTLESYEMCCLVETFPARCKDIEDFKRTIKFAYLYAKTVTLGTTHWVETNRVQLRNRRIGTSISGIAQFIGERGLDTFKTWLNEGYNTIQSYDNIYSDWFAVPKSIKTTSIKPSGSVSLLPGATPGLHYPESKYYIRRIIVAKNSDLIPYIQKAGYKMEDYRDEPETSYSVEVPVYVGEVRTLSEVSMWEQLELAAFIQEHWADNQVSCTVTFKPHEAVDIANALNFYQYRLKGISFLPKLEKGAYAQMPYEEITKEKYEELSKNIKPLKFKNVSEDAIVEKYCDTEICII